MKRVRGVLLAVILVMAASCGSSSSDDVDAAGSESTPEETATSTGDPTTTPADDELSPAASCVALYSPDALAERAFAFDGTVVALLDDVDPRAPEGDTVTGRAEFEVNEWFAGGSGATVAVWMQRPVSEGERLLVAGQPRWGGEPLDDAIAWECGFTVPYSSELADEWSAALAPVDASG